MAGNSLRIDYTELNKYLLSNDCDIIDKELILWYVRFMYSGNMRTQKISGQSFYWVQYQKVIDDLPLLRLNKRQVAYRLKKLCQKNIFDFELFSVNGHFTYYKLADDFINQSPPIIYLISVQNKDIPFTKSTHTLYQIETNKDLLLIDKYIYNTDQRLPQSESYCHLSPVPFSKYMQPHLYQISGFTEKWKEFIYKKPLHESSAKETLTYLGRNSTLKAIEILQEAINRLESSNDETGG